MAMRLRSAGTTSNPLGEEEISPRPSVEDEARMRSALEPEQLPQTQEESATARLKTLKRRRDELAVLEEIRILEEEIEGREQRLRINPPEARRAKEPSIAPTISSRAATEDERVTPQWRPSGDAPTTARRGPKIEPIPIFRGQSIREYNDFETRLRIAFRLDPQAFTTEDQRIAFTLQSLEVTLRQLWLQREMEDDGVTLDWRQMMEFLLDQIKSPINRELQITMQYQRATQREGQSVNEFAAYLATLENQVNPPYEQKHLVMHLYSKLRPEIRTAIANYNDFPQTRRERVERAATLEDNLGNGGAPSALRQRAAPRATPAKSISQARTTPTRSRNVGTAPIQRRDHDGRAQSKDSCRHCGKLGHWEKDCWAKHGRPTAPATGVNTIGTKNGRA